MYKIGHGYSNNLWWLLGLIQFWNRLGPSSQISVERHQGCSIDRHSFISSIASSCESDMSLFSKMCKTLDLTVKWTSNRWHWKDNQKLYFYHMVYRWYIIYLGNFTFILFFHSSLSKSSKPPLHLGPFSYYTISELLSCFRWFMTYAFLRFFSKRSSVYLIYVFYVVGPMNW